MPDLKKGPFIGLFNDSFPPILDGVALAVQNYAKWLSAHELHPLVVTPWNPEIVRTDYDVMRFFSLPIPNRKPYRYGYPKLDALIWRKLRTTPFGLAHAHCPFSSGRLGLYVKKKQGVPLIGTFHSKYRSDLEHSFRHTPWMVPIIMKRILDFFNACDEVWIPQAEVESTVREYGFKGELTVVENGIDFANIPDSEVFGIKTDSRRKLGISPSTLCLLFVGQHIYEKGIMIIIDALSMLAQHIDFRMDFIGAGYAAQEARARVARLGLADKVFFHGIVSDRGMLKARYAAADLFLFPSFYDNAPLVVREAAALATPSILPIGSTASEIIRDNSNGFLANRDAKSYADLITSLAEDRDRISAAGRMAKNTIVRSWEDIVNEVQDRYAALIRRTRR